MAAPTSITVSIDRDEYSRFEIEAGRASIAVTVVVAGGVDMDAEEITLNMYKARRTRDSSVYSTTLTVSGHSDPTTLSCSIYLPDLTSDNVSLLRRGAYFVEAVSVTDTDVYGVSNDFPISIVTAQELRKSLLFGLTMEAQSMRDVKLQPSIITGITVEEVSHTHPQGFKTLNLLKIEDGKYQLSWAGGTLVSVAQAGQYILPGECGSEYIVIRVSSMTALPSSSIVEELLVVKSSISDAMLRRWINQACDWLENDKLAGVFLEPTKICTDPISAGVAVDWDFIVSPLTFFPSVQGSWIDIQFPFPGLISIERLWGSLGTTDIVEVNERWIEIAERNGFVQLVPYNATTAFQFIGLVWVEALRGRRELPNFWHYVATSGLRDVDPILTEVIGKKAAMDALAVAGQAFRGGYSSQALSRDGISESVSYTASAIYGIYSATIEEYSKFLNREIKQLKGRYRGVGMVVL